MIGTFAHGVVFFIRDYNPEKHNRPKINQKTKLLLRHKPFHTLSKISGMPLRQGAVRCGSMEPIESGTSRTSLWLGEKWDVEKHGRENWVGEKRENNEKRQGSQETDMKPKSKTSSRKLRSGLRK